jgi:hypothetical protein
VSYLLDSWLGKTPVVNKTKTFSSMKFIIQTVAKVFSINFVKLRNFQIMSVVFTGVHKYSLLGNAVSSYINKYWIYSYADTKGREK